MHSKGALSVCHGGPTARHGIWLYQAAARRRSERCNEPDAGIRERWAGADSQTRLEGLCPYPTRRQKSPRMPWHRTVPTRFTRPIASPWCVLPKQCESPRNCGKYSLKSIAKQIDGLIPRFSCPFYFLCLSFNTPIHRDSKHSSQKSCDTMRFKPNPKYSSRCHSVGTKASTVHA